MRHRHPLRHTPQTVRGPIGSSTETPNGRGCMRHRRPLRHTPHTARHAIRHTHHAVRGPKGIATEEDAHTCGTHNCI
eukprot:6493605-Pyramimonas_sp.AAC.1